MIGDSLGDRAPEGGAYEEYWEKKGNGMHVGYVLISSIMRIGSRGMNEQSGERRAMKISEKEQGQ